MQLISKTVVVNGTMGYGKEILKMVNGRKCWIAMCNLKIAFEW